MGGTICRCDRRADQVSRTLLMLPWFFVNKFLASAEMAEEILGKPPTLPEIFVTLQDNFRGVPLNNIYEAGACISSLLREDMIYTDLHSNRYTVHRQEGYYSYSEVFRMRYPSGYVCDSHGRVVPSTARRLNLQ